MMETHLSSLRLTKLPIENTDCNILLKTLKPQSNVKRE